MPRARARSLEILSVAALALATAPLIHAQETPWPARITVEIEWERPTLPSLPAGDAPAPAEITMEAPNGRILEAVSWPESTFDGPEARPDGIWWLGTARTGRVRARVELPLGDGLLVRTGKHTTRFPTTALLETAQRSLPGAPATIIVKRLPWDAIEIDAANTSDGTIPPGGLVPLTVGFNLLTTEPTDGLLRLTGELRPARGGEPVWRCDQLQPISTNPAPGRPPTVLLQVQTPTQEGVYILDLRTSWKQTKEPEPSSRLGRLIRRRRLTEPLQLQAQRRVSLIVADLKATARAATPASAGPGTIVDSLDFSRPGRHRGAAVGRAPLAEPSRLDWPIPDEVLALTPEADLGDRLRELVGRVPDLTVLGPTDDTGLSWSAVTLKVSHPDRPHRLTLTITGGDPSALGVALIAPADESTGRPRRMLLDSAGNAAPVDDASQPRTCSWLVWPGVSSPVLVLLHRGSSGALRVGSLALEELPGELVAAPPVTAPSTPRTFGLVVPNTGIFNWFGDNPLSQGRNLASYMEHTGATLAVLPASLRERDRRRVLSGQADEDGLAPDRLELTLGLLAARSLSALVEITGDDPLPGLPGPTSSDSVRRGLARVDDQGRADGAGYNPLHPDVQAALERRLQAELEPRRRHSNLLGVLVRLGPGATLAGAPDTGLDDIGYTRFVKAMLDGEAVRRAPGLDSSAPDRFAARSAYVTGPGKLPWLTWKARQIGSLYAHLADVARTTAPGAILAVATPTLDNGPAGRAARRADGVGESPRSAWQAVGLDFEQWPTDRANLLVLRGARPVAEPLARDLATHPDLDAMVARWPGRGLLISAAEAEVTATAATAPGQRPRLVAAGPPGGGDEPLGHALAVLDARWVLLDAAAVAGREDAVQSFARVLRALPATAEVPPTLAMSESGVTARAWTSGNQTYLGLANDTPYPIRVETIAQLPEGATIEDLGHGQRLTAETTARGRRLALDLAPFGVAAVRADAANIKLEPIQLGLPEDLVAAQYHSLSTHLNRLSQGAGTLPNPGFELSADPASDEAQSESKVVRTAATPIPGWTGTEGASLRLDLERPHSGKVALRLEGRDGAATAISDWFTPPGGSPLELRVWLRAEQSGLRARVWIEAESAGEPVIRRAEVSATTDWLEQRIRVSKLPDAGLDRMRLRFELPDTGQLWIDDLALSGQRPSEPTLRAQRTLVAAMQKFRERRYADFARLASSYWSRAAEPLRTGATTDLSPERRLR